MHLTPLSGVTAARRPKTLCRLPELCRRRGRACMPRGFCRPKRAERYWHGARTALSEGLDRTDARLTLAVQGHGNALL